MITLTNTEVMNFHNALRGVRNPMNSWEKSDSFYNEKNELIIGDNDLNLAKKLARAGSDHRKYLRQIFVSVDINAPMYWWKEFDTYKIGTTANSTSTMHKLHSKKITIDDFSCERLSEESMSKFEAYIGFIETIRLSYMKNKDKNEWYNLIQLLPSSYNQLRTCTMNYENLINMYYARKNHKLDEWHVLCEWIETLPYSNHLIQINSEL